MKRVKVLASYSVLMLAAAALKAQAPKLPGVSIELGIASATFKQSFSSDCCGPTREATGSAFSVRIKRRTTRFIAVGVEVGASATPRPDMRDRKSTRLNSSHTVTSYA